MKNPETHQHDHTFFAALNCPNPVTWTNDIKQLFTAMDTAHMQSVGGFDLSNYNDVKMWASAIYPRVSNGSMPPPGSGEKRWTPDMVNTFGCWIQQGCPE